jgi:hypothetical protein
MRTLIRWNDQIRQFQRMRYGLKDLPDGHYSADILDETTQTGSGHKGKVGTDEISTQICLNPVHEWTWILAKP